MAKSISISSQISNYYSNSGAIIVTVTACYRCCCCSNWSCQSELVNSRLIPLNRIEFAQISQPRRASISILLSSLSCRCCLVAVDADNNRICALRLNSLGQREQHEHQLIQFGHKQPKQSKEASQAEAEVRGRKLRFKFQGSRALSRN